MAFERSPRLAYLAPANGRRRTIRQAARLDRTGADRSARPGQGRRARRRRHRPRRLGRERLGGARPAARPAAPIGDGDAPRLAVGGGAAGLDSQDSYDDGLGRRHAVPGHDVQRVADIDISAMDATTPDSPAILAAADTPVADDGVSGPFLDDGTLLKPVAVDTTVEDGRALLQTYTVKSGDTLTGIARRFDVSMMTLWWANNLKAKDDLHVGQVLRHPAGQRARRHRHGGRHARLAGRQVQGQEVATSSRPTSSTDPNLVVGQVLVVPGAKGKPIPTPKPTKKPSGEQAPQLVRRRRARSGRRRTTTAGTSRGRSSAAATTSASTSTTATTRSTSPPTTARASAPAAAGTVIFAGWKSNGGGYQVWIAHGSGLYTTYNHMSAVTVGRGQHVGRGQQRRPRRPVRQRDRPAPPLRGLDRPRLERRPSRQPARLPLVVRARRRRPDAGRDADAVRE